MRFKFALAVLFLLALVIVGCGSSTHTTVSGNWLTVMSSSVTSTTANQMTFTMAEGTVTGTGPTASAPVTVSSLAFTTTNGCFDGSATVSGTITGAPGTTRSLALSFSEAGNAAQFTVTIPVDNNSGSGTYTATGGNVLPGGTLVCPANDNGSITMTRQ